MSDMPTQPAAEVSIDKSQVMKLLCEFGPLVVFFVVNSQAGRFLDEPKNAIFWGTGTFMAATIVALIASRLLLGRVPVMPLISGVFVVVFGGLTLLLHDELFIKMKPTIVNLIFAVVLVGGLAFGKPLLKYLFGDVFRLTEAGWKVLTLRWAAFFVVLAGLNEVIWRGFSTDFWIAFKIFGIMPLTVVFAVLQIGLMKHHEFRDGE